MVLPTIRAGHVLPHWLAARKFAENLVKKFLLAAVFNAAFATLAFAQTPSSVPPRDPPFGKGIPDNDSMYLPGARTAAAQASYPVPPRDPPFGKGNAGNDTLHEPSSAGSAHNVSYPIPPRDPPFGKGNPESGTMPALNPPSFWSSLFGTRSDLPQH
jgi:hypothetical protein